MAIGNESYPLGEEASNPRPSAQSGASNAEVDKSMFGLVSASKTVTAVLVIGAAGFAFGQRLEEANTRETVAGLQAENVVKSAALEKSKVDISDWSNAYRELQQRLAQKDAQIAQLTVAVSSGNNCDYLRQEIESTKRDIRHEQFPMLNQMDRDKVEQQRQANIARLDGHLSELIEKFGTCARGGA